MIELAIILLGIVCYCLVNTWLKDEMYFSKGKPTKSTVVMEFIVITGFILVFLYGFFKGLN